MPETRRETDHPPDIRLVIPPRVSLLAIATAVALVPLWPPIGTWLAGDPQRSVALYSVVGVMALLGMIVYDTRVSAVERIIVWRRSLIFLIPLRTRRLRMEEIVAVDIDHTSGADCSHPEMDDAPWMGVGFGTTGILISSAEGLSRGADASPVLSLGGRYRIILQTRQRDRYLVFRHTGRNQAVAVAEMLSAQTGARLI